jgi:16S rRNA A1518/A1519 N6-dimethyltransferase RsmA/KsgA/DIM1 with predicted DNA glycosylase/AP lyase activity
MKEIEFDFDMGQHLLLNGKVIETLIDSAELNNSDRVIEIGSGSGNITREIAKIAGKVLGFEIDERFKPELEKLKEKNIEIIYGNCLKYNWRGYNKIVANIPFLLSEAVIMKSIEDDVFILSLVMGGRFKNKLESDEKMGLISRLFFKVSAIEKLNKNDFSPVPRENSWIIKLVRKRPGSRSDEILKDILIKKGKVKNAILFSLVKSGKTKNESREMIEKMNLNKQVLDKSVQRITGNFILLLKEKIISLT